jgi:DNA-directed RNA polymerase specialized sigma24 family protein
MDREPGRRSARSAERVGDAHLQQDEEDPDGDKLGRPVPQSWIPDLDRTQETDRLDRLLADAALISRLQWQSFEGPEWEVFATELARYGFAVLRGWLRKGTIFEKVRARGPGGLPPPPSDALDDDAIDELAADTVVIALNKFRKVLMEHRWDHARGATLKTFFIGQCLWRFSNVYRSWEAREREYRRHHLAVPSELLDRPYDHVEAAALVRMDAATSLRAEVADDRTRRVLLLTSLGCKQREIAKELGLTEKAVEAVLYRHRKRIERKDQGTA